MSAKLRAQIDYAAGLFDRAKRIEAIIDLLVAERERCAKIAENPGFIEARDTDWDEGVNYAKRYIAEAIRDPAVMPPDAP